LDSNTIASRDKAIGHCSLQTYTLLTTAMINTMLTCSLTMKSLVIF